MRSPANVILAAAAVISLSGKGALSFSAGFTPAAVASSSYSAARSNLAAVGPGSSRSWTAAPPSSSSSSSSSPSCIALHATPAPIEEAEIKLADMREELTNLTQSLELANQRQLVAKGNVVDLREEKGGILSKTEEIMNMLKRSFVDEITDIGDQIEGAQDSLRKTMSNTVSEISIIQGEASERASELKSEISDLESRLKSLRRDAADAKRERDALQRSINKEVRDAKGASRREIEELKAAAAEERREISQSNYDLESRIAEANAADNSGVLKELEDEKRVAPSLPTLKQKLMDAKNKFLPRVSERKEQISAKEMFYDQSLKGIKEEEQEDLAAARSVSEEELTSEEDKLKEATSSFEAQMDEKTEELRRAAEEAAEPLEFSAFGVISKAKQTLTDLIQGNAAAIQAQRDTSTAELQTAIISQPVFQEQYDAEYKDAKRTLKEAGLRSERKLGEADRMRKRRREQLGQEKEELTYKLSTLMTEEREASEVDYQMVVSTKTSQLDKLVMQREATTEEIQGMKSNLIFVQDELNRLEKTCEVNAGVLEGLEEERTSFRKQMRRTAKVAFGKITRRG